MAALMVRTRLSGISTRLSGISAAIKRRPLTVAITVTAGKAAAADLMVQTLVERREKVDLRRTALFGAFGGLYQGMFQYGCVTQRSAAPATLSR